MKRQRETIDEFLRLTGQTELESSLKSLEHMIALYAEGRPKLLAFLKESGVSALAVRQQLANAIGRYIREGTFNDRHAEEIRAAAPDPQAEELSSPLPLAPPGYFGVNVRCAGNLGGDSCPGQGYLRHTLVQTDKRTVFALYQELREKRGYTLEFHYLRVGVNGAMADAESAMSVAISDGMTVFFVGPNNG